MAIQVFTPDREDAPSPSVSPRAARERPSSLPMQALAMSPESRNKAISLWARKHEEVRQEQQQEEEEVVLRYSYHVMYFYSV